MEGRLGSTSTSRRLGSGAEAADQWREASWIAASQRGDTAAFNRLVLRWEKGIYNLALRMLQDPEDAADAAQEVFIKAFRAIRRFRQDANFSTWLYRIAANHCITRIRHRGRRRSYSLDDEDTDAGVGPQLPVQESHERSLLQRETGGHVIRALASLPPEQRLLVELKFFRELTFEEIAAVVQLPLSTVKSRLYKGLETLKRQLAGLRQRV